METGTKHGKEEEEDENRKKKEYSGKQNDKRNLLCLAGSKKSTALYVTERQRVKSRRWAWKRSQQPH